MILEEPGEGGVGKVRGGKPSQTLPLPGPTHPLPPAPLGFGRFLRRLRQDSEPPVTPASAPDKYRFKYSALESGGAAAMAAVRAGRRLGAEGKILERKRTLVERWGQNRK